MSNEKIGTESSELFQLFIEKEPELLSRLSIDDPQQDPFNELITKLRATMIDHFKQGREPESWFESMGLEWPKDFFAVHEVLTTNCPQLPTFTITTSYKGAHRTEHEKTKREVLRNHGLKLKPYFQGNELFVKAKTIAKNQEFITILIGRPKP